MNDLQIIKREVEDYFHLERGAIDRESRKREIVYPRQLAHYLAKERNGYSLERIGKEIGNLDHATVLNSLRVIGNAVSEDFRGRHLDPEVYGVLQRLRQRLAVTFLTADMEWTNNIAQM